MPVDKTNITPDAEKTRTCDGCSVCCYVLSVKGMKGPFETCAHQCEGGCLIYPGRPTGCREFECEWLRDQGGRVFGEEHKPDKSGVMIQHLSLDRIMLKSLGFPEERIPFLEGVDAWHVIEGEPHALNQHKWQKVLDDASKRVVLIVHKCRQWSKPPKVVDNVTNPSRIGGALTREEGGL